MTLSSENLARFGSDPRERFAANLALVHRRIAAACEQVGRPIDSVRLLPITKTVPAEILRLAWAAGVTD
ncbi:YggS family pyridoxal phosphate-dependent enzyme, partial [Klebsiella pneumoniae]